MPRKHPEDRKKKEGKVGLCRKEKGFVCFGVRGREREGGSVHNEVNRTNRRTKAESQ